MEAKMGWLAAAVILLLAAAGCASRPAGPGPAGPTNPPEAPCEPTDQDQYVYRPRRLQLLHPCARASGTVMEISSAPGTDGDIDLLLRLDATDQGLLAAENQKLGGYLMVEAVCQHMPPVIEALRVCASDPDPFLGPFPHVGDRIWVEGRHVLDLGHSGWAELHPLYRWGRIQP